jgi:hypothetical protein
MNPPTNVDRLVVYTVLMGQVGELNPVPASTTTDYVCFTDQKITQPNGWNLQLVEPLVPEDTARSSRHAKVNPHLYFKEYSRSIYIDSSVWLKGDPELLWNRLIPKPEIAFGAIYHSFHFTLLDEIKAISSLGLDSDEVILRQLEFSVQAFPGYLNARPIWGGILARRHNNQELRPHMENWFAQIIKYSKRDQLSLPLALRSVRGDQIHLSHLDNRVSDFHIWPSAGYQKPASHTTSETVENVFSCIESIEQDILLAERNALLAERNALLAERHAVLNSTSWRLTRPLRNLKLLWPSH